MTIANARGTTVMRVAGTVIKTTGIMIITTMVTKGITITTMI